MAACECLNGIRLASEYWAGLSDARAFFDFRAIRSCKLCFSSSFSDRLAVDSWAEERYTVYSGVLLIDVSGLELLDGQVGVSVVCRSQHERAAFTAVGTRLNWGL